MPSKGKIHDVFQNDIQQLTTQAGQQADMIRGKGTRPWNDPKWSDASKPKSPLDIPGITDGFNRDQIDTNYGQLIQSGSDAGTVGDVICVKTQGDYIAEMERGYRARHATPVRCIGHAMARRKGHSMTNGVFQGGVLKHVQDALKGGQS
jgi:hypothetical protein